MLLSSRTFYWKSATLGGTSQYWTHDGALDPMDTVSIRTSSSIKSAVIGPSIAMTPVRSDQSPSPNSVFITAAPEPANGQADKWSAPFWNFSFQWNTSPNNREAWLQIEFFFDSRNSYNDIGAYDLKDPWTFEFHKTISVQPIGKPVVSFLRKRLDNSALNFAITILQKVLVFDPHKPLLEMRALMRFNKAAATSSTVDNGNPRLDWVVKVALITSFAALTNLVPT